jgi:hypothetical protein
MRRFPPSKIRQQFILTYELYGAQKAIDFLSKFYRFKRMRIVVDGRKAGKGNEACYDSETCTAYFRKRAVGKRTVLHEFYHHLASIRGWNLSRRAEENEADSFAKRVLRLV